VGSVRVARGDQYRIGAELSLKKMRVAVDGKGQLVGALCV
jgi:hypothetical protein